MTNVVTSFTLPDSTFLDGADAEERAELLRPYVWASRDMGGIRGPYATLRRYRAERDWSLGSCFMIFDVADMTVLAYCDRRGRVQDTVMCFEWVA